MKRSKLKLLLEEPFRLFFPIGVLMAVLGVGLWPLYHGGVIQNYPGLSHSRLMSAGFFGAFLIGFLSTAIPRMLSAPKLLPKEVILVAGFHLLTCCFYLIGLISYGDGAFLVTLILLRIYLFKRFSKRQDMPPPGIVLAMGGYSMAMGGCIIFLLNSIFGIGISLYPVARLFLYEGFILCPILGIAPFMFPGFGGVPNRHDFPESRSPTTAWRKRAWLAGGVALLLVITYFIEGLGRVRLGSSLRMLVVISYIVIEIPLRFPRKSSGSLAMLLQTGIFCMVTWLLLVLMMPEYRVALDHLLFIGGFSLIVVGVATRVILGHSGQGRRLRSRMPVIWIILFFLLTAMATRISADFLPEVRTSHLNYAAVTWVLGILLWAFVVIQKVQVKKGVNT